MLAGDIPWARANTRSDRVSVRSDRAFSCQYPDMTDSQADRVIAGRPYNDPSDLVKRHILPRAEYDKIADQVTAKR